MSTIVKIILGILSYIISLEVTHITHQKFIKLLADSGYTIKNGDKLSLYEEIDAPTNYISKVMLFLPYVNILASCYESVITINALEYEIDELLDMDIITPLTIMEKNYYESHDKSIESALEIISNREREFDTQNTYQLEKNNAIKTIKKVEEKQSSYYQDYEKILSSNIDKLYQIELFRILRYCITNKIDNLNMNNLISSIQNNDNIVDPYYLKICYLETLIAGNSMVHLITSMNQIINMEHIETPEKEFYLKQIYDTLEQRIKKNKLLTVYLEIDSQDLSKTIIETKSNKKERKKNI